MATIHCFTAPACISITLLQDETFDSSAGTLHDSGETDVNAPFSAATSPTYDHVHENVQQNSDSEPNMEQVSLQIVNND